MRWNGQLDKSERRALLKGAGFFQPFNDDLEIYTQAWNTYRDELVDEFIKEHPGKRPYGCWVVDLVPRFGERRFLDPEVAKSRERMPNRQWGVMWGIYHSSLGDQEPEYVYLQRHDLLTPEEQVLLQRGELEEQRNDD